MLDQSAELSGLSVLGAFAHPDDEGFGCGGTLAMLVARGAGVTVAVATNGDVGEISDPALAAPDNLHQVRQEEMRQAMKITGVQDVRFMGYRDSGMAGTPDNDRPESLYQAQPNRVVAELVEIIRQVKADVVITHDPTGGYGHPDHTTLCGLVTQAFSLAGDASKPAESTQGIPPRSPRLLYYVCFPRSNFRRLWQQMLDAGITPPFASMDIDSIGSPDEAVTTVLKVDDYVETKIASLNCHRTQMDPNGPFAQLPLDITLEIMSTEYFTLAVPEGAEKGADLLAGLA